ncbi:MAG: PAS domain-containing sensor histidine kinase [Vampirovibrionia bacterium]
MKQAKSKLKFNKSVPISIRELLGHLNNGLYTRQTLVNLFRTFLETTLEDRLNAVVLMKIDNTDNIESIISRLNYSQGNVFVFNQEPGSFIYSDKFKFLKIDSPLIEKEEFLVILSEKFSATLYWSNMTSELYGLHQGAWSFNPGDARYMTDYLYFLSNDDLLKDELEDIKADRRYDERFTTIMTKLVGSLENRQRDLICANKELKELHEKALQNERLAAIGQVSSVIAHELRNPLGLIDLYSKLLITNCNNIEASDDEQKEIINTMSDTAQTIRNATSNLDKILSELLDYSKPLELKKDCSDLEGFINDLIKFLKPSFDDKNIGIKLKYNITEDISVSFDKLRLNQAVLNIIKNGLEISKPGDTIYINVDCRANDGTVYIKVTDSGPGIPKDNLKKLFTPYFSTKEGGTGLGLAQAKKIMKAHKGNIEILSTSSKGTTFALILPGATSPIENIEIF